MMKNRILFLTCNTIPYVKELQILAGSVAGCIVMQQLDYWFQKKPDGFYKFLEPPTKDHALYRQGDSWVEELGMSAEEFRTAFDKLGFRHKSKRQFEEAQDKFQGKYYCSYVDRRENLTYYFRNHAVVDKALDKLIYNEVAVNQESRFTVNRETPVTVNRLPQSMQAGNPDLQETGKVDLHITEITQPEITKPLLQLQRGETDLVFPAALTQEEREAIKSLLEQVQHEPPAKQQELLDELDNAIKSNSIKRGNVYYIRALIELKLKGKFMPCGGLTTLSARNRAAQNKAVEKAKSQKLEMNIDPTACEKGARFFSSEMWATLEKKTHSDLGVVAQT